MKNRNKRLVSIVLTAIFAASLSFSTNPKKVKADNVNQADIKTLVKQALSKKIENEFAKGTTSKFETFDENAPLNKGTSSESERVIVQLNDKPAAENASKTADSVKLDQQQIIQKVKAITGEEVKRSFGYLVNGFSLDVKKSDISKIEAIPGVKNVTEAKVYHPDLSFAKNLTQVYSAWKDYGYKGEGLAIAIIDTGIDYTHKDFRISDTSKEKLHEVDVVKLGGKGKYFTDKVPYGFNFADNNQDVIDANTEEQHGTHVAGIVAANGHQDEVNSLKAVQGIAPEAQLLAMKVFSNTPNHMNNAYDDDIIAAIEDSVLHKADIINMSLGSAVGFQDENSPEQKAVKNATDKGTLVVISAGNSAISSTTSGWNVPQTNQLGVVDTETVGDPGTAKDALTVASYENTNKVASILDYTSDSSNGKLYYAVAKGAPEKTLKDIHNIVDVGFGQASNFNGLDLTGKIALVQRGTITFSEKFLNAQKANAAGVIIFDKDIKNGGSNDPLTGMSIDQSITIPVVGIGNSDGYTLKNLISKNVKVNFTDELGSVPNSLANDFSPFTSWGPTPSLDFKPEISAPGGNIYSTQNNNKYTTMSGTSMAAPNVSGSEALLLQAAKQENLGLSGREMVEFIKDNVVNTAKVEYDKTDNSVPYSPRRQGSGLIQVEEAIKNKVIVTDDNKNAAVALKEIGKTSTFNLNLKNYDSKAVTYTLGNSAVLSEKITDDKGHFKDYAISGANTSFSNNSVTIPAKGQAKITVTITLPDSFKTEQYVEGFINFKSNDANVPSLNVPYLGFYGNWSKPNIFDAPAWDTNTLIGNESLYSGSNSKIPLGSSTDSNGNVTIDPNKIAISPDETLAYNSAVPILSFLRNAKTFNVDVVNKNDGTEKVLRNIFVDNEIRKDLIDTQEGDGGYNVYKNGTWDGKLYNSSTGKFETAPDGQYYLRFTAKVDLPNAVPQTLYLPVKVDTAAPKVQITSANTDNNSNSYTVTWKATDQGVGLTDKEVVLVNGKESEAAINYDNTTGQYSSTVTLDSGVPNSVAVGVTDYAGNVGINEIAVDSPVVFYNLSDGLKLGKSAINKKGFYEVTGKVESSVKKIIVGGADAAIDSELNFTVNVPLKEGSNAISVDAYDKNGKAIVTKKSYAIILNTQNPVINIASPKTNDGTFYTEQNTVVISGNAKFEEVSADNSISVAGTQLNSSQFDLNTGNFSTQVAVKGNTVISVDATDAYGNKTSQLLEIVATISDEPLSISFDNLSSIATLSKADVKDDTLKITGTVNHKPKVFQINGVDIHVKDDLTFSKDFKLNQGDNKFLVYAEDIDGKIVSNYSYLVQYDSNAPKLKLESPIIQSDGKIYTNKDQVELKGTVQDDQHGFTLSVNGNIIVNSSDYEDYGVGKNKDFDYKLDAKNGDIISIEAEDTFGNSFTKQIHVVVDKTAPKAPKVTLSTTAPTNKDVTVTLTAATEDKDIVLTEYSFDNKTWLTYKDPFTVASNVSIYARETDKAGNISETAKAEITNIDKVTPKIKITGISDGSTYYNEVTPNITVSEAHAKITMTLDGNVYHGGRITAVGKHKLVVKAEDAAGNKATSVVRFTIEKKVIINNSFIDELIGGLIDFWKMLIGGH